MPGTLRRRLALTLVIGLLAGMLPQAALAAAPTLSTATIASGLVIPWDVAFLPDGKMVVTERPGRVRVYASGSPAAALVKTINLSVVANGESGLMGVAVDTNFAANPYVYVCATRNTSGAVRNEVLRYRVDTAGNWSAPTRILGGMLASNIHNGCAVEMDLSGRLWVSMGDANQAALAQNRNSLNGKILRMNRDGGTPSDNPVIGGTRNVVYSMGHRNPQGIAFRPGTSQVFAIEHGPQPSHGDDEINLLTPGGNFGWPCYTGFGRQAPADVRPPSGCEPAASYLNPVWSSGAGVTLATSGGTFVGGSQWADFDGNLFVSNLKESDIRRFTVAAGGAVSAAQTLFDGSWGRLRAAVLGPGGQLYVTTSNGSNDRVIRISPMRPSVARVSGADRYATAAALSLAAYPSGATEAIVATGADFPDALAGSAAAGKQSMPVLLTTRNDLPMATRNELDRLNPARIWILGGTSVISESVRSQIAAYATTGEATRLSGEDRYATAARIAQQWYGPGVQAAFIAVGTNFADALAGAPAAALRDSPLLLVRSSSIPAATASALQVLKPQRIYVLGGTAVISQVVASQLDAYTAGPVTRLAGADRYATANAIVRTFWVKVPTAYVASGTNFPDALAGGAVAGKNGEPMVLSARDHVPWASGESVIRLSPRRVTILGGTVALTSNVASALNRLVASP